MTTRQLNTMVDKYNGLGKTDKDFVDMLLEIQSKDLLLFDGENDYDSSMTRKDYRYRICELKIDEFEQVVEGKTIGYLRAMKCWRTKDLEMPFEILAYVS